MVKKLIKLYDLNTYTSFVSKDVIFYEIVFSYPTNYAASQCCPVSLVNFGTESATIPSSPLTTDSSHSHTLIPIEQPLISYSFVFRKY